MNIREVEEKTGLTRANVRFYEKEALLNPARMENGYRNYSEDDVKQLLRIRLMRELGIAIEEIRRLQQEETELEQVLENRMAKLEQESERLQNSQIVCRNIWEERVAYRELDAEYYLRELEQGARPANGMQAVNGARPVNGTQAADGTRPANGTQTVNGAQATKGFQITDGGLGYSKTDDRYYSEAAQQDVLPEKKYPFRRFFARSIDEMICQLLFLVVWYGLLHIKPSQGFGFNLLSWAVGIGLTMLLEPVFLMLFAATPGKWIFGIRVYDREERRLSYTEAFTRTWSVLTAGEGLRIPVIQLYFYYKGYKQYMGTGIIEGKMSWDADGSYTFKDGKIWRCAACGAAFMLMFLCSIFCISASMLPRYRGDLTPKQFAANYNEYYRYYGGVVSEYLVVADDGSAEKNSETDEIKTGKFAWKTEAGAYVIALDGLPQPEFVYTERDGILQSISLEYAYEGTEWLSGYRLAMINAVCAFVGAQKEVNAFNFKFDQLLRYMQDHTNGSFSFTEGNIDVRCQIETRGYLNVDTFWIPETENVPGYYHIQFVMEKTE